MKTLAPAVAALVGLLAIAPGATAPVMFETPELPPNAPPVLAIGLMFVNSVISVTIFTFGHGPLAGVRDRLVRLFAWPRVGDRTDEPVTNGPQECFFRRQGSGPGWDTDAATDRTGTAGLTLCSLVGQRVITWSIKPHLDRPDHFELTLAIDGRAVEVSDSTRPY